MELANSWEGLSSCSWLIEKPQLKKLEIISSKERVGQEYCFDCCCLCMRKDEQACEQLETRRG